MKTSRTMQESKSSETSNQSQSQSQTVPANGSAADDLVKFQFQLPDGSSAGEFDLPRPLFDLVSMAAAEEEQSVQAFIADAIRLKVDALKIPFHEKRGWSNLEKATLKAEAFMSLVVGQLKELVEQGGGEVSKAVQMKRQQQAAGVDLLHIDVERELHDASYQSIHEFLELRCQLQVPASRRAA